MEADPDDYDTSEIVLRVPACDICRSRKIKCDRKKPCSSCVASKVPCRTTKRAPEKKQRVLLSSKYDEGLANVNKRLEDLQDALQSLLESNKAKVVNDSMPTVQHHVQQPESGKTEDGEAPYEGDSSFNAHSKHVTDTLGVALSTPSVAQGSSPAIDQAAIQKLLKDVAAVQPPSHDAVGTPKRLSEYPELNKMPLPSMSLVLKLFNVAQGSLQRWFIDYQVMDFESFKALCQGVYFPTKEYSIYTWILVNGGLFFLFRDGDGDLHEKLSVDRAELLATMRICKRNVDTGIHALPLCIDPSLEACQAIILGASIAMEEAKGALAWKLTSVASRMCLDLGLHRTVRDKSPDNLRKRLAFWYVYSMDKGLAFNFGRTPTGFLWIHDYDITVDRPDFPAEIGGPWSTLYLATLDFAVLQGEIYEQLFSTSAQKQAEALRVQRARDFAAKIQNLRQPVQMFAEEPDLPSKDLATFAILSTDILIGCILAIIYRVIPPPQPAHPLQYCDEAVESSRAALNNLQRAWQKIQEDSKVDGAETWELFLNWTILFVPFVPFVVLFGNTIAQRNSSDLEMLRRTVTTLEAIANKSPAGNKLYGACTQFVKIAETFLAHDTMKQPSSSQPSPFPVDQYTDFQMLPDFPVSQQDWDGMLNDFDLGLGAESAREMTSYFEPFMSGSHGAFN